MSPVSSLVDPAQASPFVSQRLGSYTHADSGASREVLTIAAAEGGTLVVDRLTATRGDTRLVGHICASEPPENAALLAGLYLDDPSRGHCRPVGRGDLRDAPQREDTARPRSRSITDAEGSVYRVREVSPEDCRAELRWTRCDPDTPDAFQVLAVRDVVAHLQNYEPARAITAHAIRTSKRDSGVSVERLQGELTRLRNSPIVLNRQLREAVLDRLARGETMSEIAIRCGRVKRDRKGGVSGETSWLARRIGHMAEGGQTDATPWVHSDVLALIARDGLGICPLEVEL